MHRDCLLHRRRGFTLIEATVGAMVLGFALAVFSAAFLPAADMASKSRHLDEATAACSSELEAWRTAGYNQAALQIPSGVATVTLGSGSLFLPLPGDLPGVTGRLVLQHMTVTGSSPTFQYQQSVAGTGRVQLQMTVTWSGSGKDSGSVTLTTLLHS